VFLDLKHYSGVPSKVVRDQKRMRLLSLLFLGRLDRNQISLPRESATKADGMIIEQRGSL
jgi:hypothetical protein